MEGRLQNELGQQDGLKTELEQKENRKTIEGTLCFSVMEYWLLSFMFRPAKTGKKVLMPNVENLTSKTNGKL